MHKLLEFMANHWLIVALFVIAFIWLIIEESRHQGAGGSRLTPANATHLINHEHACVVDIRNVEGYRSGHIIGSKNIPQADLKREIKKLEKFKQKPVIVVCATGQKAVAVMHQLRQLGFAKVFILAGGISAWKNANLPLAKK